MGPPIYILQRERIYYDVYQHYMISESGYEFLSEYAYELSAYLWRVTHFGTSLDYVLMNVKFVEKE